jgi:hypothetical protein
MPVHRAPWTNRRGLIATDEVVGGLVGYVVGEVREIPSFSNFSEQGKLKIDCRGYSHFLGTEL